MWVRVGAMGMVLTRGRGGDQGKVWGQEWEIGVCIAAKGEGMRVGVY